MGMKLPLRMDHINDLLKGSIVNEWFLPTWAGVDPETGVDTYYTNGVGSETTTSYTQATRVYQGTSALPTISGGLNLHVDFKGFFLDASGYYAGGHQIYESWHRYLNQGNLYTTATFNGYDALLDRWQNPGDHNKSGQSRRRLSDHGRITLSFFMMEIISV